MVKTMNSAAEVQENVDAVNDRFWNRKYRYGLNLLGVRIDKSNKDLFIDCYLGGGLSREKSLVAAIWTAANAKNIDYPAIVEKAIRKALVYDTPKNFVAKNELLDTMVCASLMAAVALAIIIEPIASVVVTAAIVGFVFNSRYINRPNMLAARIALGVNGAALAAFIVAGSLGLVSR